MSSAVIQDLTFEEIEEVNGGVLPFIAAGIALVGLAVASFNSGYTVGKDMATRDNAARAR